MKNQLNFTMDHIGKKIQGMKVTTFSWYQARYMFGFSNEQVAYIIKKGGYFTMEEEPEHLIFIHKYHPKIKLKVC